MQTEYKNSPCPVLIDDHREIWSLRDLVMPEVRSALEMLDGSDKRIILLESLADEIDLLQVNIVDDLEERYRPTLKPKEGYTAGCVHVSSGNTRKPKSRWMPSIAASEREACSGEQNSTQPGHSEAPPKKKKRDRRHVEKRRSIELTKTKQALTHAEARLRTAKDRLSAAMSSGNQAKIDVLSDHVDVIGEEVGRLLDELVLNKGENDG